jgi:hypothetical protein
VAAPAPASMKSRRAMPLGDARLVSVMCTLLVRKGRLGKLDDTSYNYA